jgi:hypothetical protein
MITSLLSLQRAIMATCQSDGRPSGGKKITESQITALEIMSCAYYGNIG